MYRRDMVEVESATNNAERAEQSASWDDELEHPAGGHGL